MFRLTYRELLEQLKDLSDEQLDMDVTVLRVHDLEMVPVQSMECVGDSAREVECGWEFSDVLDENHPYLVLPL